jgi:DNA polymerase-1
MLEDAAGVAACEAGRYGSRGVYELLEKAPGPAQEKPKCARFPPADRLSSVTEQAKPPVFLLDTMSFIFRAYHAMQRSRPMSTRGGLPTAAIYVFVNMIKKLRQDFAPLYFAAVFDMSGEVFRDERARTMGPLRKWDSKTQSFVEVSYEGYKANREAMPEDLRRQIPYIRRSLEALHIPILGGHRV